MPLGPLLSVPWGANGRETAGNVGGDTPDASDDSTSSDDAMPLGMLDMGRSIEF
jgi:hypothetical protein